MVDFQLRSGSIWAVFFGETAFQKFVYAGAYLSLFLLYDFWNIFQISHIIYNESKKIVESMWTAISFVHSFYVQLHFQFLYSYPIANKLLNVCARTVRLGCPDRFMGKPGADQSNHSFNNTVQRSNYCDRDVRWTNCAVECRRIAELDPTSIDASCAYLRDLLYFTGFQTSFINVRSIWYVTSSHFNDSGSILVARRMEWFVYGTRSVECNF